jgi:hypothetical protein
VDARTVGGEKEGLTERCIGGRLTRRL